MRGSERTQRDKRLIAPLSVAMTADERRTVRHAAHLSESRSVSTFIRTAAVKAAERVIARDSRLSTLRKAA